MNNFQRKKQVKKINALIEALSYMTVAERQEYLLSLCNELKKIDNQIANINKQQEEVQGQYTHNTLTPSQVKTLFLGCGVCSYALGGMLGTLCGTSEVLVGMVSTILLALPLTTLASMGLENDVLNNRDLIKKYTALGKSKKQLLNQKNELLLDLYNAQSYSMLLDKIANKEYKFIMDTKEFEKYHTR